MRREKSISTIFVLMTASVSIAQTPLGTEFTYQGQLQASGSPVISTADFQFALFDAAIGGNQINAAVARNNVAMINGAFAVSLDFGVTAFNGEARWLEVAVRSPAGAGGFSTLAPRQSLTSSPNATYSQTTRGVQVEQDGSVGIGTVLGAFHGLFVNTAGQVSVGTIFPEMDFDVHGDAQVRGTAYLTSMECPGGDILIFGGRQNINDDNHLIWRFGDYPSPPDPLHPVENPELRMISPVTEDELAGFYRDDVSGNGVMFADDKNFRAPNPADASTDIWYCCLEGPEAAMYVRGTARLINGRATIELPDHFRNLAFEPGMTVQLTPLAAESKGLAAIRKQLVGIEVVELGNGTGSYEFDWRVEAVRKGWEDYKVIRPWLKSDADPDKAWRNRLKAIEERRAHGKPSPGVSLDTPRPAN